MEQQKAEPAKRGEIRATSGGHESQQSAGIRIHLFPGEQVWAVWVQNGASPPLIPPQRRLVKKMIDCHVLTGDGATLEAHWLRASPKPATAYRQCEQWDTVSRATPCSTLLRENEKEQVSLK